MIRIAKAAALVSVASLALAACGSSADDASSSNSSAGGSGSASGAVKVAMAYDVGGRGDQSFNDAAGRGLDRAKNELGADVTEATAQSAESESTREERLQQFIDAGYTNIVAVGYNYAPSVRKVAAANPNVHFALIDSTDAKGANVQNIVFAEQEGSYLAGVAAALKTKTNKIGFVGGVQTDLIKKFEAGYVAGAKATKPTIDVKVQYLSQAPDFSGFQDPAKGKTAAAGMIQQGADVIYHASGGSGAGVLGAVHAANKMAIGVDSDQAKTAAVEVRPNIITSVVKQVDVGVYSFVKQVKEGTFKSGPATFDLKGGGVSLATTGGHINDIMPKIDEAKQGIIDGKITVPTK